VTRTDRRGSISSRALVPPPPRPRPPYVAVGTCNVAETTRGRTSAGVDPSAGCSPGNSGWEVGTAGSDENDVAKASAICTALKTAAGEEGSDGFSTTREGEACSGEGRLVCSPLGETVFECASGTDSSGGVDVLFCGVLIWDKTRKEQRRVAVCLFAAAC